MAATLPQVSAAMFPASAPPGQLLSGNPFLRTAILHGHQPPPPPPSLPPAARRRVSDKPLSASEYRTRGAAGVPVDGDGWPRGVCSRAALLVLLSKFSDAV